MKRIIIALLLAMILMMTLGSSVVLAGVNQVYVDPSNHVVEIDHDGAKGDGQPNVITKTPRRVIVPPDKGHLLHTRAS